MKNLFLLTIILSISTSIRAQNVGDSITLKLNKISINSNLVGFAVAIVNKDSIVYAKGFGYANLEAKTPYTINTIQPIASISKTLLGVALMKAQEMGKLNLNDNINDYLPFKIYNPNFPNEKITIQQLANHTSSIIDGDQYDRAYIFKDQIPPFYNDLPDETKQEVKEAVDLFNINEWMPISDFIENQYSENGIWYSKENFSNSLPGSTYKYSNMGANIAAYIIDLVSGESYIEFVQKHILDPLQMTKSGWPSKNYQPSNVSTLYWYGYPTPEYEQITYGDAGFMTNITDFSKYLITMIQGYNGEDNILKATSYKEMMKDPISSDFRKGIFWSVDLEKIGHSGNDPGVISHAYFLRENGNGIIIFVNTSETENAMSEVRDIYRTLLKYVEQK
ncbi:serine hydrolase [Lutibacter sp.]|uniref:serine hydrolase domain-containing protein n=1 Tax=Lutibacter sp. TaxID=1925666 RepID=UPI001A2BBDD4|nr:serine hydrolase domain-containing protein [Lutibacter sp.]MBI9040260.1 serine hydrolase [Lutibacter sp.]